MISLFKSLFNFLVTIIKASNGGSRRYLTAQQQKMLKRISYLLSMSMLFLFFSHFLFFIFLDFTKLLGSTNVIWSVPFVSIHKERVRFTH